MSPTVATLLAVQFIATIVAALHVHLFALERRAQLLAYAGAFFAYSLGPAAEALDQIGLLVLPVSSVSAISATVAGLLVFQGARLSLGLRFSRRWLVVALLPLAVSLAFSGPLGDFGELPAALYFCAVALWAGFAALREDPDAGRARIMAAASLAAWGGLTLVRVGVRIDSLAYSTLNVALAVFILAGGLSTLLVYLRMFRVGIARADAALARQARLLNDLDEAIIRLAPDLTVTEWSPAADRLFGVSEVSAVGTRIGTLMAGAFRSTLTDRVVMDLAEKGTATWLMEQEGTAGETRWIEIVGRAVRADDDSLAAYTALCRDVTDRVLAEEDVRESQSRYRTLFESSPLAMWEEDFSGVREFLDGIKLRGVTDIAAHFEANHDELLECMSRIKVLDVNDTAVRVYGASSKEELLGGLAAFVDPAAYPVFRAEFAALAAGATSFVGETASRRMNGERLDVRFSLSVPPGYEETLGKVLVSDTDLTERNAALAELEEYRGNLERLVDERTSELTETNRQLREATLARDKFLANISHEMRTPLNSIIGFTSIVGQGLAGDVSAEAKRQLEMANRSGRQLLSIVEELLEFSRVQVGVVEPKIRRVNLRDLVENTCETVDPLAREKGIEFACHYEGGFEVRTDADRVQQILLSLLSNALKFTESGAIEVFGSVRGARAYISVSDTGPGIDPDKLEVIFDAFHQLAPARDAKHSGAGLGLSIAREVARILGGDILAESEPGVGSTFTFVLPVKPAYISRTS